MVNYTFNLNNLRKINFQLQKIDSSLKKINNYNNVGNTNTINKTNNTKNINNNTKGSVNNRNYFFNFLNFFRILFNLKPIVRIPQIQPPKPSTSVVQEIYQPKIHMCFSDKRNKLAWVMGLNYNDDESLKLNGCINDTEIIKLILLNKFNYLDENIIVMTDNTEIKPTKQNIQAMFKSILERIEKENITELFISYSGHGTFLRDYGSDEKDNQDEALVPLDCDTTGIIKDDELHSQFLSKIPESVNVFSLMDCCHSGTIMDLKYKYQHNGGSPTNGTFKEHQRKSVNAKILKISGSRDDQYSSDAFIDGEFKGAMTASFEKTLQNSKDCRELLVNMTNYLKSNNFSQRPELTSSFNYSSKDKLLLQ